MACFYLHVQAYLEESSHVLACPLTLCGACMPCTQRSLFETYGMNVDKSQSSVTLDLRSDCPMYSEMINS